MALHYVYSTNDYGDKASIWLYHSFEGGHASHIAKTIQELDTSGTIPSVVDALDELMGDIDVATDTINEISERIRSHNPLVAHALNTMLETLRYMDEFGADREVQDIVNSTQSSVEIYITDLNRRYPCQNILFTSKMTPRVIFALTHLNDTDEVLLSAYPISMRSNMNEIVEQLNSKSTLGNKEQAFGSCVFSTILKDKGFDQSVFNNEEISELYEQLLAYSKGNSIHFGPMFSNDPFFKIIVESDMEQILDEMSKIRFGIDFIPNENFTIRTHTDKNLKYITFRSKGTPNFTYCFVVSKEKDLKPKMYIFNNPNLNSYKMIKLITQDLRVIRCGRDLQDNGMIFGSDLTL